MYWIYILRCADGTLYTGTAADVDKRCKMHNSGKGAKYTRSRLPALVVYREALPDKSSALRREIQIKKLPRIKKLELIKKGGIPQMKLGCTLIAVHDMQRSKDFYISLFGMEVTSDFGANVTLSDALALQTLETWEGFIEKDSDEIAFGSNAVELYFETTDFDGFIDKLKALPKLEYVHPPKEHSWGQRAVRIYDPDRHIIEIGEDMSAVTRRFIDSGMSIAETAARMDVQEAYIRSMLA